VVLLSSVPEEVYRWKAFPTHEGASQMKIRRVVEEIDDDLYRVTVNGKSVDLTRNQFERYREWCLNNADPIEEDLFDLNNEQLQILEGRS
jgi:hypothetical protein